MTTRLTPAYKITIGGKVVDTTDEPKASTIVDVTVALDMDTPADTVTLVLGNVNGLKPSRDDTAKIALGYTDDDELTQVMAGTVATVEPNLATTRVVAHAGSAALLRTFVDQTFEGKAAGDIIRDLAKRAGVEVATASDGINFPAYVVDGRRSVQHHMQDIADFCGFDLYVDSDGKLVFEKMGDGNTVHVLEFGKDVLDVDIRQNPARAASVEVWGESPTGSHGDEAWPWLIKDFSSSKGSAGSGAAFLLERPVLRTHAAAQTAAEAALTTIQRRTRRGYVRTVGNPKVKLGDAVRLRANPTDSLNSTYHVRRVTHRITKLRGFTTTIGVRGAT
jgi:phage protein D